ncbi:MAG: hydrogenase maturation nickel metallochaperone HypA [Phycisphaerales bacterium]|nr:hydrogenase maturation nickel metallochaperone HypA [Phycisphaerales bacterium]
MHEMSIAIEIVHQAERIAREHQASRVDEIEVEVGVMQQVVHEALHLAFEAAVEQTWLQGVKLRITEEPLAAICDDCQNTFTPQIDCFVCPRCGQANARITAGDQILLKSMVCQTPEETAES